MEAEAKEQQAKDEQKAADAERARKRKAAGEPTQKRSRGRGRGRGRGGRSVVRPPKAAKPLAIEDAVISDSEDSEAKHFWSELDDACEFGDQEEDRVSDSDLFGGAEAAKDWKDAEADGACEIVVPGEEPPGKDGDGVHKSLKVVPKHASPEGGLSVYSPTGAGDDVPKLDGMQGLDMPLSELPPLDASKSADVPAGEGCSPHGEADELDKLFADEDKLEGHDLGADEDELWDDPHDEAAGKKERHPNTMDLSDGQPSGCTLRRYEPPGKRAYWLGILPDGIVDCFGHHSCNRAYGKNFRTEIEAQGFVEAWLVLNAPTDDPDSADGAGDTESAPSDSDSSSSTS